MIFDSMYSRFVFPFSIERHSVDAAEKALRGATADFAAPTASSIEAYPLWSKRKPHRLYIEEMLRHVARFLFCRAANGRCRYLGTSVQLEQRLFRAGELALHDNRSVIVTPPEGGKLPFAEVFLLDQGVGLVCVNLCIRSAPPTNETEIDLGLRASAGVQANYLLSRLADRKHGAIRTLSVSQATELRLGDRLRTAPALYPLQCAAKPGSLFYLKEIIDALTKPLRAIPELRFERTQEQLSVYTVAVARASAGDSGDIADAGIEAALFKLAQIEEATHPGASHAQAPVRVALLSRVHAAAVSLLGAAHIMTDQRESEFNDPAVVAGASKSSFNAERPLRGFIKYFSPWLVTQLESLVLRRILQDVHRHGAGIDTNASELLRLRGDLLNLSVHGHFDRVSTRNVLHRYLRACQKGLDVRAVAADTRAALADFEARWTNQRQTEISRATAEAATRQVALLEQTKALAHTQLVIGRDMADNVRATRETQDHVARLERFIISFYAAHLVHLCFGEVEAVKHGLLYILPGVFLLVFFLFPLLPLGQKRQAHAQDPCDTNTRDGTHD